MSAMKNHNGDQTEHNQKKLFLDNLQRYEQIKPNFDSRAAFEALYNCFENAARHSLEDKSPRGYIRKLKESPEDNLARCSFMRLYKQSRHNTFLKKIKKIRSYQPIYNNETGVPAMMTKSLPFETFLDVLYTIRNNLRHGQKEYTERSELIIQSAVSILEEYAEDLYKLIYAEEIETQEKLNKRKQELRNSASDITSIIFNPVTVLILFWVLAIFYFSNRETDNFEYTRRVDCKNNPQVCEQLEEKQYEQEQYDDYDWARPY